MGDMDRRKKDWGSDWFTHCTALMQIADIRHHNTTSMIGPNVGADADSDPANNADPDLT